MNINKSLFLPSGSKVILGSLVSTGTISLSQYIIGGLSMLCAVAEQFNVADWPFSTDFSFGFSVILGYPVGMPENIKVDKIEVVLGF